VRRHEDQIAAVLLRSFHDFLVRVVADHMFSFAVDTRRCGDAFRIAQELQRVFHAGLIIIADSHLQQVHLVGRGMEPWNDVKRSHARAELPGQTHSLLYGLFRQFGAVGRQQDMLEHDRSRSPRNVQESTGRRRLQVQRVQHLCGVIRIGFAGP